MKDVDTAPPQPCSDDCLNTWFHKIVHDLMDSANAKDEMCVHTGTALAYLAVEALLEVGCTPLEVVAILGTMVSKASNVGTEDLTKH